VLYLYSAAAIAAAIKDKKPLTTLACLVGLAFVLFAFYGSGRNAFLLSLGLMAAGGLIFVIRKRWIGPPTKLVATD
jgi:basic amino acid/polyamine antiporter, APA family